MDADEQRFLEVAERLRVLTGRVASLNLAQAEREVVLRRLIAVTNTSKHDVDAAAAHLARLERDVEQLEKLPPFTGESA